MHFKDYHFTSSDLQARIQEIETKTVENELQVLKQIYCSLDLTTLEATDHPNRIYDFCKQALQYSHTLGGMHVAAVCVYMPFIAQCRELLAGSGIEIATVACSFPSGQIPLHLKLEEVRWAVAQGADEIDMVITRGAMLSGAYDVVLNEIKQVKDACGKAHLKVILETGELKEVALIRKASELALMAGADFLKTSTGKIQPAATPEAAIIMLDTIKEYYDATGKMVGFKPAGGVASPEAAVLYYKLVDTILGKNWLHPKYFRIGASRLAGHLVDLIKD